MTAVSIAYWRVMVRWPWIGLIWVKLRGKQTAGRRMLTCVSRLWPSSCGWRLSPKLSRYLHDDWRHFRVKALVRYTWIDGDGTYAGLTAVVWRSCVWSSFRRYESAYRACADGTEVIGELARWFPDRGWENGFPGTRVRERMHVGVSFEYVRTLAAPTHACAPPPHSRSPESPLLLIII